MREITETANKFRKKTYKEINKYLYSCVFNGLEICQVYILRRETDREICCLLIREESGGEREGERDRQAERR